MIKIFDTTLRDGEQAPGFAMNIHEKMRIARQLEKLRVDVIEAGFPVASPEDFASVKAIAQACRNVEVCGLARCNDKDITAAIEALHEAAYPRIHVFIATSPIHLKHKLNISPEEAVRRAVTGVRMAAAFTPRVEFSPEDATRSDRAFLKTIIEAVIEAGATTINVPDTVGYLTPDEYGSLIKFLKENVVGIDKVTISTHCHNDLGLAVANSLAGVKNGATQIECTINGIGERAGNAALEEVVMAIKTRRDLYQNMVTNIDTTQLLTTSQLVCQITDQQIQPNKAIVGNNAFAHGAGIHQHGMLANASTYEIMRPEDVGRNGTQLVLGKHSGKHALIHRYKEMGIVVPDQEVEALVQGFKVLADKKKQIYDEDLRRLMINHNNSRKAVVAIT